MRYRVLSFALVICLFPLAAPAQDKKANPYKDAKVGDYLTYKVSTSIGGKDFNVDIKQVVTAKDDNEVTLSTKTNFMGKEIPGQVTKIDLTKPFDPAAAGPLGGKKGSFEKKEEGKEKVKIGDKTYECTWTSGVVVAEVKGNKFESEVKFWVAKTVPLSGLVKMEMKSQLADIKMELTGSGNEK